eukprot:5912934-Prymnesium_polylepis.2
MAAGIREKEEGLLSKERQVRRLELEVRNLKNELKRSKRQFEELEGRVNGLTQQAEFWQAEASDARNLAQGDDSEAQKLKAQ